jgi:enoyl-CoA hydratase/carnithine racemase
MASRRGSATTRAAALEVAREIAGKSPDAIRAAKRMLNNLSVDPGPALLAESVEQMKLMGSANQLEAVAPTSRSARRALRMWTNTGRHSEGALARPKR